jgi:hypothetical protein
MTKLISALMAAVFATATLAPVAFAADDKSEPKKEAKKDAKKDAKKEDKK